jgi:hypothetical protein
MSEPLDKETFETWKDEVFDKFVTNEFCHLRDKVDWIFKMLIGNLIGVILTLAGILFALMAK